MRLRAHAPSADQRIMHFARRVFEVVLLLVLSVLLVASAPTWDSPQVYVGMAVQAGTLLGVAAWLAYRGALAVKKVWWERPEQDSNLRPTP